MNDYLKYKDKKYGHIVITNIISKCNGATAYCKCDCGNTFEKKLSVILKQAGKTSTCGFCYNGIPIKDFIGKRFGHIVISDCKYNKGIIAECKCDCGHTFERRLSVILKHAGKTSTCGFCYNGIPIKNFIGKRFGHIVISDCKYNKGRIAECKCDCGHTFERRLSDLLNNSGNTTTCGNCYDGIPRENYIGKNFGNFKILEIKNITKNNQRYYAVCKCICGNIIERPLNVFIRTLKSNSNLYCGNCINGISKDNYIGRKYGFLTIIGFELKKDHLYAVCKCDCGIECYRKISELGKYSSCGECYKGKSYSHYIGQKIGYLTIINVLKNSNTFFECKCDCGDICIRTAPSIFKTKQKYNSCGNCINGISKDNYIGKYFGIYKILNINNGNFLLENKYTRETKLIKTSDFLNYKYILKNRDYLKYLKNISFGKLNVIDISFGFFDDTTWHCRCECGNELNVSENDLFSGNIIECNECKIINGE